jgi:prephenate dehydratase
VAIQGELGSNSHMAVAEMFGDRALTIVPCGLSAEVIERLTEGQVDCAVLPIENSLHGSVAEHYDLLLEHPVRITGETLLRIQHHVIAAPGVGLSQVRRVLSHPVALSQCRRWLRAHPEIEAVPFYDTAGSVKELMDRGWRDVAGIAPERVAAEYGGEILVRGVEDHAENYTRFYLLEPEATAARRSLSMRLNKMTVGFAIAHQPGTLILALEEFRSQGMNLTRIESRPVRGRPWEYVFFVDAQFGESAQADALLWELKARCEMVKELGRFRAASHLETPFGRKSLAVPDLD